MPLARAIHGNQGKALLGSSTIAQLTKWSCEIDLGIVNYVAVSGAGWQRSVRGNKKASGSLTGKYDPDSPIDTVIDGDNLVSLVLYHNATQRWISMTALLGKQTFSAEIDGHPGVIQEWECAFESDGPVSKV